MSQIIQPARTQATRFERWVARRRTGKTSQLPPYGLTYFDNLYGKYKSFPPDKLGPEVTNVVGHMENKRANHTLTWHDLYTLELMLARLLVAPQLPSLVGNLRSRYRDVAGQRDYETYMASKPPDPTDPAKEQEVRAEIEYLLQELHLRYAMLPIREKLHSNLVIWVNAIIVVGMALVLMAIFLISQSVNGIVNVFGLTLPIGTATVMVVLFEGAMGGLLSMQQRFQRVPQFGDPVNTVAKLNYAWFSIFESPIAGASFAGVLYLIIVGGLLQGALFPTITDRTGHPTTIPFATLGDFLQQIGPASGADYAKLVVWSFIAGFAERFVPDTLSRFVAQSETDQGTKK